ncbi:protein BRI1-5 ENHANCED 1-like [Andrographis paniculata]|uniref:protein BRI1-5 ENHANCED 1-like n=1 Tax=Andrographis paniculata TaxID=175694 RepID=UPI0021E7C0B6|nr:protein BRI1-5 ENHANCED 1-like [Andrographis paniculata]XP_051132408.1 protein BRI1-5 ENHANCED 1-like [Andrographis paniculata]XP_051132409.1 protein BRI1-5 ENHANCED 1-like [Andrographis paniculata]XP_051132411.1 protein BRI1-5 ENHANCED 1-like [Andrographis paniculata]XP_051132412.1 protein BRI1-5 ENHANCED 1-like [Andrographis paniculata]XP_051132413.1 protein BRI1-5 ENHANCED 1-like [Andrographis paniculata]XP_051132414.1 protein BRI1-5 ENHANCED 1-like [Andrographis paniculata]XP_05113241
MVMSSSRADKGKGIAMEFGKVCVTGGTGYLASWMIQRLLERGYSVNTTVRSHQGMMSNWGYGLLRNLLFTGKRALEEDSFCSTGQQYFGVDVSFLRSLPGARERLTIYEADMDHPESFRAAVDGCFGVFLVAHPTVADETLTVEEVCEQTAYATLGILRCCVDAETVKRVVYTSAAITVMFGNEYSGVVDENTLCKLSVAYLSQLSLAKYTAAKAYTELTAQRFAERNGMGFVSVLPSWIHGPFLTPTCPGSVYTLMSMLFRDRRQYKYISLVDIVHVDDVARAHIFLLETPSASGRYICSAVETSAGELYEFLCYRYPESIIATPPVKCLGYARGYTLSTRKLSDLGFAYNYGLEEMYDGAVESCTRTGYFLPPE